MQDNVSCNFDTLSLLWYFNNHGIKNERFASDMILIALFIPSAVLNILVLVTVWRKVPLRTPSNVFLCNMAISDLAMAVIGEPLMAIQGLLNLFSNCHSAFFIGFISGSFGVVSYVTITAGVVDRYIALKHPLRYQSIVTVKRSCYVCLLLWIFSFIISSIFFTYKYGSFILFFFSFIASGIMVFCYIKIFIVLHQHHNQIQAQVDSVRGQPTINLSLFKKTVVTLLCILLWMILSYSLFIWTSSVILVNGYKTSIIIAKAWVFSVGISCSNSLINPLIYCWRMSELRLGMKETWLLFVSKLKCS